jgi:hypothetical protein
LRYIRYADDWLLGFCGPRSEAEEIKAGIAEFLREHLKLELSEAKTLITHARTQAARFLGYEVVAHHNSTRRTKGQRSLNGSIGLKMPREVVKSKAVPYMRYGKPIPSHGALARLAIQHRGATPSGVPGTRGVLPNGVQPAPTQLLEVDHGDVNDQDACPQVADQRPQGL